MASEMEIIFSKEIYSKEFISKVKDIENKYAELLKCEKEINALYNVLGLKVPKIIIVQDEEEHRDGSVPIFPRDRKEIYYRDTNTTIGNHKKVFKLNKETIESLLVLNLLSSLVCLLFLIFKT